MLFIFSPIGFCESSKINKLLYMYRIYYLAFSIDFKENENANDITPLVSDKQSLRAITKNELKVLQGEWEKIRLSWQKKSLLLSTAVTLGQTMRISASLVSHSVPLSRNAFSNTPINEQIQINAALSDKSEEVKANFRQLRFVKSFLSPTDDHRMAFFIFSPSWDLSSKDYRVLLESYLKKFPEMKFHLHSVVIDDPKERIFEANIFKELFPHRERYTHDNTPKFIAFEILGGQPILLEEGEALKLLYERFLQKHRGFLDEDMSLFRKPRNISSPR